MAFDFEIILAAAFVLTAAVWIYDRVAFYPKRVAALNDLSPEACSAIPKEVKDSMAGTPKWVTEIKSYFVIVAVIFGLRSFVVEPFQIPSGSMLPTLEVGDFILVNKFDYGVRLPVTNTQLIPTTEPKRGDVIVFKYPKEPSVNYIKRLIGLPGDTVSYHNKRLTINGKLIGEEFQADLPPSEKNQGIPVTQFKEDLLGVEHEIYKTMRAIDLEGDWVVPEGHYFAMGDNRDNSSDSRVWGFVPEKYMKGRAFYIWMHWNKFLSVPNFKNNSSIE